MGDTNATKHQARHIAETFNNNNDDDNNNKRLLQYIPKYKVLICREHGGVRNWNQHLRDLHSVDSRTRKNLKKKYDQLKLENPKDVCLPPPLGPPFTILGELINALLCLKDECGHISTSRTIISQHYNREHNWYSTREDQEH
jgi:hypothetical protein